MKDKEKRNLKKELKAEADRLFHIACLKYWGNKCFFNDSEKKAYGHKDTTDSCHHFKPKGSHGNLRYVIDNGVPVCWPCHNKLEQVDFTMQEDIVRKRGIDWNDDLNELHKKGRKGSFQTIQYYEENIKRLKEYIDKEN